MNLPSKKRILIIIFPCFGLILLGLLLFFLLSGPEDTDKKEEDYALIFLPFHDEIQKERIYRVLERFHQLYPEWEVKLSTLPYRDLEAAFLSGEMEKLKADFLVISNPSQFSRESFKNPPLGWTGSLWGLYYNREVLKELGIDPEKGTDSLSKSLKAGTLPWQEFKVLLSSLKEKGKTPVALGASQGWPALAWFQHITALMVSPEISKNLLSGAVPVDLPELQEVREEFAFLMREGLFPKESFALTWSGSVRMVAEGRAAFCLMNDQFLDTLRPGEDLKIGFLPFPESNPADGSSWAVGTLLYLVQPIFSEDRPITRELFNFLTSPGITELLSAQLGIPFFSPAPGARASGHSLPNQLIPSITLDPGSPYSRSLWESLKKF